MRRAAGYRAAARSSSLMRPDLPPPRPSGAVLFFHSGLPAKLQHLPRPRGARPTPSSRERIPPLMTDRVLAPAIDAAATLVREGVFAEIWKE